MRLLTVAAASVVGVVLLALLPFAGAAVPLRGSVTTCSSNWSCDFVFNTSTGKGWANGSSPGYSYPGTMSLRLPGEANTTTGLPYSTYIQKLTGTYTYWTIGTFLGSDVNTGTVVTGTTNSNFTITCVGHSGKGGGCNYIYTTDNGTVTVRVTLAEMTATTLSCSPTTIVAGKTSCTVTVSNLWNSSKVPVGKLHIVGPYGGKLSDKGSCTLSSKGTCAFNWTAPVNGCGAYTITATYLGTTYYYTSTGSIAINVTDGC